MTNDGGGTGHKERVIGGRYRLVERIGSGGMGTVWRALDQLVEREVAVKQPRLPGDPEDAAHQRAAHRLYREARAAARVDHPAAVSIHDVVVEDGLPWIVMELVRGESLHEVLQRGPLRPAETARIGLSVLGALRAAHDVGIVHRDVKPANVLLGPHRRVVLTDFGIAHIQGEESLTVSGEFIGSLEFIAPERMSGRGAGPASDLWSLGVLLYAAVEGWSPFRRTTLESTLAAILAADPPEPKQAGPLGSLIVRLLAKDPERRPDAREVGSVLEAVAEGWPVPEPSGGAAGAGPQDASGLREFAEDSGTVRLRGAAAGGPAGEAGDEAGSGPGSEPGSEPGNGPGSGPGNGPGNGPGSGPGNGPGNGHGADSTSGSTSGSSSDPTSPNPNPNPNPTPTLDPTPQRRGSTLLRPIPVALLGVLLIAGTWFTASAYLVDKGEDVKEMNPTYSSAPLTPAKTPSPRPTSTPTPAGGTWIAHEEKDMNAVLSLPAEYKEMAREGSATDPPRLVVYDIGLVQVRLTQWDKAPRPLLDQAEEAQETWNSYNNDASSQYTRTSFKGYDAVLVDTTYGMEESPSRVMQLLIVTEDDRMYELRVDMPKGTPSEKKGTAVFKGARDRLEIE
ncbi:Serine/threonine protein kinase [Streptomyces sp. cf386]|uniref:serine/threonine-protein kinase n=1 Tax=Streptomyces sp. cf386 TaxID=1761904 RepID=UPI00088242A6|nr:serine/threonine-protein kinase [Streptomyces sp. cf386]SDN02859.1 Serine/threonine protein kinase [Streptomyces sp. cf386]